MIHHIDHLPGRTIRYDGAEYLFFSGTAYLGIAQNPAFHALLTDSMRQYGAVFGSSRNGNLRLSVYEEAEAKLAGFVGAPAALTLSSGMMAGQAVVNWLKGESSRGDAAVVYAPHAHPALWHEPSVVPPQMSFADWVLRLGNNTVLSEGGASGRPRGVAPTICTNSLDAVRSEYYNFDWVADLPTDRSITLVIDDSHGLGVMGAEGRGIWPQIRRPDNVRLLVTASLAKAMGLPGGVIFSDPDTIAAIRQTAFFGACSPMPPAYLAAYCRADALYAESRRLVKTNIAAATAALLPTGLFRQAAGYPVLYTTQDDLYPYLLKKGIFIYSFAYPTPADRANTRVVVSAFHQPGDFNALATAIHEK